MTSVSIHPVYALITSAKNEENFLRNTLESVLSQTCLPIKWIIVSDGSTDGTDHILKEYDNKFDYIQFVRLEMSSEKQGFASKVFALTEAYKKLKEIDFEFIGVLDADVSFEPTYFQNIFQTFQDNPKLGISGGYIYEPDSSGIYRSRQTNRERCVAGAIQMFRRECYERIGGLFPIRYGGEDTLAEIMARVNGWEIRAFPQYRVLHHKSGLFKRGVWKERIRMGKLDYVLGYHPAYEVLKFIGRIYEPPFLFGAFVRMYAYFLAMCTGEKKIPPPDILRHIRKEQWGIVRKIIKERGVS